MTFKISIFADNGIIHSLKKGIYEDQLLENFVLSEFEKRRKLNLLPVEQFCYYKSAGGQEIDLVFEMEDTVYAIEIKATRKPGARDLRNLRQFSTHINRPVKRFLFYLGEEYHIVDDIKLIPVGALFRGQ